MRPPVLPLIPPSFSCFITASFILPSIRPFLLRHVIALRLPVLPSSLIICLCPSAFPRSISLFIFRYLAAFFCLSLELSFPLLLSLRLSVLQSTSSFLLCYHPSFCSFLSTYLSSPPSVALSSHPSFLVTLRLPPPLFSPSPFASLIILIPFTPFCLSLWVRHSLCIPPPSSAFSL